jgi:hypothetical protein
MQALTLCHGRKEHTAFQEDVVFFSTTREFSERYGEVKEYEVSFNNLFDSTNEDDVNSLISSIGVLVDSYDEKEYDSYESLLKSGLLGHDTWETFELYINNILCMGYDGMRIFEGGVENFVVFNASQYKLKSST